ncbi:interleukin-31 receptor subunit alpha [Anolis carolinensis]|uniref:Interleukin 31 receptor A n=1 Tax=Anolis carolinensis TaxID=28377 RepID=G1KQG8_ANOCA|nr:PREDICTED: interleukin-31 receptor subunit alpha [Anolis carolinensis]XP_016846353.1 PREDICTED: interleukin-31 receptor subunit alpha [Anolis carolinensis]|eukprot:XP_008100988.1 PREDICTED: interleukin-31 receptor subunit alpha [Anolis carolinensis]
MILNKMLHALLWFSIVMWMSSLAAIPRLPLCTMNPIQPKPEHLTCIFYYSDISSNYTLTCNWTAREEAHTGTTYTLTRKSKSGQIKGHCTSRNGSCSIYDVPYAVPICLELKAENQKEEVKPVHFNTKEILKPDPPEISKVEPIAGKKQMLRVSWKRPHSTPKHAKLKCQIHYTATTKNHTDYANVNESEEYNLTNLWDFTTYIVVIRCTLVVSRVWSEWSAKKTGTTEEQAPLTVNLWRIIKSDQFTNNRIVHLLWKECKEFPCSGIVNGYRVKYFVESKASPNHTKNISDNNVTLNLTKEAHVISVTAFNEAGESPEATLRIPSFHEETDPEWIVSLKASVLEEQMFLEWETSDLEIQNYIIEWYYEPDSIKRSWQKVTNITKWTSPKGAFIRFKYYYVSVYPLYKGEIKSPRSTRAYFHEGIPEEGPSAEEVENIGKNEAIIKWKEIPEAKRNGLIMNYTVFYKAEDGTEFGETVNSSVLQYRIKSLQANTKYTAHVMANTSAGGKNGTATTFITSQLSVLYIVLTHVIVGIFMLCLLIIGILVARKRHALKNALWPKIPHPHITMIFNMDQQPIPLRSSPSVDETYPAILEIQPCFKDHNKLELPNSEDCLKGTDGIAEVVADSKGILWNREHEALPSTSYVEHDCKSPTMKGISICYENKEAQEQSDSKEETKINPYLKNSVFTRKFVVSENLDQNTKAANIQPVSMTSGLPNSNGQQYVALETFQLFPTH